MSKLTVPPNPYASPHSQSQPMPDGSSSTVGFSLGFGALACVGFIAYAAAFVARVWLGANESFAGAMTALAPFVACSSSVAVMFRHFSRGVDHGRPTRALVQALGCLGLILASIVVFFLLGTQAHVARE